MQGMRLRPMLQATLAATLFGASTPFAKLLLGRIEPVPLAAFLYLGSALGACLYKALRRLPGRAAEPGPWIRRPDLPWLAGATLSGGVAAPIVLMFSLRRTPAATASLLLNFESVTTTFVAASVFREAIGKRVWWAVGCVTVASALLSLEGGGRWGVSLGALGVLGACLLWGIDNNFTRNISTRDPLSVTLIKSAVAGGFSLVLAAISGSPMPGVITVLKSLALGAVCYGMSIVLFISALQGLGAARTSAFFGTAPFVGAALSLLIYLSWPGPLFLAGASLMALGIVLLLGEEHHHRHVHDHLAHEHRHSHDDNHHLHEHPNGDFARSAHTHAHIHDETEHEHPHAPDIHHRHGHD